VKRNFFSGKVIAQPGDDPWNLFEAYHGLDMGDNLIAYRFVKFNETFKWYTELETEDGTTMQAHDFETEDAIKTWLREHSIEEI
jgi:hypothetical protein